MVCRPKTLLQWFLVAIVSLQVGCTDVRLGDYDERNAQADLPISLIATLHSKQRPIGQISAVTADGNGDVFAVDAQAQRIVVLPTALTRDVRTIGQQGSGPGDFSMIAASLVWAGDSLVAFDRRLRRFSYFNVAGLPLKSIQWTGGAIDLQPPMALFGAAMSSDIYVAARRGVPVMRSMDSAEPVVAPEYAYVKVGANGELAAVSIGDTVAPFIERTADCRAEDGSIHPLPTPLSSSSPLIAFLDGRRAAIADPQSPDITIVDLGSGDVESILSLPLAASPLSSDTWEAQPEVIAAREIETVHGRLSAIDGSPCPVTSPPGSTFPYVRGILADTGGRLWLETTIDGEESLTVMEADGAYMGSIALPPHDKSVAPYVRDGRLYLVSADGLGVQAIQVFSVQW